MSTKTIPRHNLADAVVTQLQQQLSLGQYQPGEKMPSEAELMSQFGVGRSTIREAIRILANTGALDVRQGSGTFVQAVNGIVEPLAQRLKRAGTANLDEVRQLLEIKIAEKAALNRTENDIEKIKGLLGERKSAALAGDIRKAIQTDILFHISIAEASRNDILADLYRTFADQVSRHLSNIHSTTESFVETQEWHEALFNSIVDQDPEKAWHWAARIVGAASRHDPDPGPQHPQVT